MDTEVMLMPQDRVRLAGIISIIKETLSRGTVHQGSIIPCGSSITGFRLEGEDGTVTVTFSSSPKKQR